MGKAEVRVKAIGKNLKTKQNTTAWKGSKMHFWFSLHDTNLFGDLFVNIRYLYNPKHYILQLFVCPQSMPLMLINEHSLPISHYIRIYPDSSEDDTGLQSILKSYAFEQNIQRRNFLTCYVKPVFSDFSCANCSR